MKVIYKILNKITGKFYIGRSRNFKQRRNSHLSTLRRGIHGNQPLQRAFNKYGEKAFEFIMLKELKDDENLIREEQNFLDELSKDYKVWNTCYNTSKNAKDGGNLCSPKQRKANSERNKKLYQKEGNPNWKGGKTYCECGNRKVNTAKVCQSCQDKTGENNPFYGKEHTEETKRKLSQIRKGIYNGNQQKTVIIEGIDYISISEASRQLQVSPMTIIWRIKSKNKKFKNYFYK